MIFFTPGVDFENWNRQQFFSVPGYAQNACSVGELKDRTKVELIENRGEKHPAYNMKRPEPRNGIAFGVGAHLNLKMTDGKNFLLRSR